MNGKRSERNNKKKERELEEVREARCELEWKEGRKERREYKMRYTLSVEEKKEGMELMKRGGGSGLCTGATRGGRK